LLDKKIQVIIYQDRTSFSPLDKKTSNYLSKKTFCFPFDKKIQVILAIDREPL